MKHDINGISKKKISKKHFRVTAKICTICGKTIEHGKKRTCDSCERFIMRKLQEDL